MNLDQELQTLQAAWRRPAEGSLPQLRGRVARGTRMMRLGIAIELMIAVVFMAGTFRVAMLEPTPEFVVLAIGVWIVSLTAFIYSWWNRAGTWRAEREDTREFLRLSLRRCESSLRAVRIAAILLAMQTLLLAAWQFWYWAGRTPRPDLGAWLIAACVPIGFAIGLLVVRKRRLRELAQLQRLQHELFD